MSRDNPNQPAGYRFYDPATEKSATERKNRLGAIENDIGFELLRGEFAYQVHLHIDKEILDPATDKDKREVLVKARQLALSVLEPAILTERGVKRAQAEMNRAQAQHDKAQGK